MVLVGCVGNYLCYGWDENLCAVSYHKSFISSESGVI